MVGFHKTFLHEHPYKGSPPGVYPVPADKNKAGIASQACCPTATPVQVLSRLVDLVNSWVKFIGLEARGVTCKSNSH